MYIFPHCVLKNMGARDYAVNIMGRSSVCILNPSDNLGQCEDPWCYMSSEGTIQSCTRARKAILVEISIFEWFSTETQE